MPALPTIKAALQSSYDTPLERLVRLQPLMEVGVDVYVGQGDEAAEYNPLWRQIRVLSKDITDAAILLAHEMGHVLTLTPQDTMALIDVKVAFDYDEVERECKVVYRSEYKAWVMAKWLLSQTDFSDWDEFERLKGIGLKSYSKPFGFSAPEISSLQEVVDEVMVNMG